MDGEKCQIWAVIFNVGIGRRINKKHMVWNNSTNGDRYEGMFENGKMHG